MSLVWVNGELVDKAEARVSPFDHGFLYGDGVWEPLRVFGGKLFRPADHLDLLWDSAGSIGLVIPHTRDELTAAIEATVRANHRTDGYVRVIVSRGPGTIGPDPRKIDPQVYIIAEEYQPFPAELQGHGLHAVTADGEVARPARILGQTDLVTAKQNALRDGCLEAVLIDIHDFVTGGTEGKVVLVRDGRWDGSFSKPDDAAFRVATRILWHDLKLPCRSAIPRSGDLYEADEMFLAGTSCGVIGIVRLDGRDIGSGTEGPVTRAVREAYHKLTRGDAPPGTIQTEGGRS